MSRARRGEIGLVRLPSRCWGIRWGRKLSRDAGVPLIESTQTRDRSDAQEILERRRVEVYRSLGDVERAERSRACVRPIQLDRLISEFLTAYAAGELPGRRPVATTIGNVAALLLGQRGGLLTFAERAGRAMSLVLDAILVTRWLEEESRRVRPDTIRLKLIAAKRLATYAETRGLVSTEKLAAIRALRPPPSSKGRARVDGVPSSREIAALLDAMRPRRRGQRYDRIAELQLRLGLRRGEVLAIQMDWLCESEGVVHIRVQDGFDTKTHEPRVIDGVDAATFELAREVIAMKARTNVTASGYREAFDRACVRLEAAGTPWRYRNKSHSLRAAYASASRLAGVPLPVVSHRLGHASEQTTVRHYLGRSSDAAPPGPFAALPLRTATPATTNVVSLADRRRASARK